MFHPLTRKVRYSMGDDSTSAQPASQVASATPTAAQTFLSTYQNQATYYQSLLNQTFMANVGAQADTYASTFQNTVIGTQWVTAVTQCAAYLATTYPNDPLYATISNYLFVNPGYLSNAYQAANWASLISVQSVYQFIESMQTSYPTVFPAFNSSFYTTDVPYMINILTTVASPAYQAYTGLQQASQNNVSSNTSLQNVTIEIQQWIANTNPLAAQYGITPVQLTDMINNAQSFATQTVTSAAPQAAVQASTSAPANTPPVSSSIVLSSNSTSQIPASVPASGVLAPVPSVPLSQAPATAMINVSALSTQTPDPTTEAIEQAAANSPVSVPLSAAVNQANTFTSGIIDLSKVPASVSAPSNLPLYALGALVALFLLGKKS
jgi:hypothetical protein